MVPIAIFYKLHRFTFYMEDKLLKELRAVSKENSRLHKEVRDELESRPEKVSFLVVGEEEHITVGYSKYPRELAIESFKKWCSLNPEVFNKEGKAVGVVCDCRMEDGGAVVLVHTKPESLVHNGPFSVGTRINTLGGGQ